MLISINDLSKKIQTGGKSLQILHDINMDIDEGEMIAVTGASGSGKSTLLSLIGAMDTASSGTYFFRNKPIHSMNRTQLQKFRKENVSFIFQEFALMEPFSVYENIEMPLLALGVKKSERKKRILLYAEQVGISHLLNTPVRLISGGEKQRCAIARALVTENNLILADEPTGALDSKNGQDVMDILMNLNKAGKTIVIVTHDERVAGSCQRICCMKDGTWA